MKKTDSPTTSPAKEVTVIGTLDQLQAIIDTPLYCQFRIDGKLISITCKRVSQALDEQVRAIRREAQPPFIKERNDYDYMNAAFLKTREEKEKIARSLIVYSGCPMIAAKTPGLTNRDDIHRFVKGLLTENIIELISLTIQAGGMELADRANFTSPATSAS